MIAICRSYVFLQQLKIYQSLSFAMSTGWKNPNFLKIGENITFDRESGQPSFSKGAYFLGKMIWAKGYSIEN
jgi:hypothetical protein